MSQEGQGQVHRYPIRLATRSGNRLWNRLLYVLVALEAFRVGRGLLQGELLVVSLSALLVMVPTLIYLHRSDRKGSGALVLSSEGVAFGRQNARWEEIERIAPKRAAGRWGKRYDAFVLVEPKSVSRPLLPNGRYDHIPFGYWWPDWRTSAIRDDIARWAPALHGYGVVDRLTCFLDPRMRGLLWRPLWIVLSTSSTAPLPVLPQNQHDVCDGLWARDGAVAATSPAASSAPQAAPSTAI